MLTNGGAILDLDQSDYPWRRPAPADWNANFKLFAFRESFEQTTKFAQCEGFAVPATWDSLGNVR